MVPSWASPELVEVLVPHKDAAIAETSRMSSPRLLLKRKVHGNHWRPDEMAGLVHGGAIIPRRVRLVPRSSVAFGPETLRVETNSLLVFAARTVRDSPR